MALPMVTAAVTLFYLSAIPIHIAVRIRLGADSFFGFGISAFETKFALRQSLAPKHPGGRLPPFLKKMDWPDALKSGLRSLKYLAEHIKIERLRLDGSFGSDDAALTALVCGSAAAVGSALGCTLGRRVRVSLQPDFSADSLRAELVGMISVRVGHIMLAALLGAYQYGSRRLKEWTSIPLRAS